jgi:hypothetical protein
LIWRRFPDVDASQSMSILATMEGCDSVIGSRLLPLVGRMTLFGEILKEELDCEPGDVLLDVDVQGRESQHLRIVPGDRRPFELSIATKVSSHDSSAALVACAATPYESLVHRLVTSRPSSRSLTL